jgi:hypothetical protein
MKSQAVADLNQIVRQDFNLKKLQLTSSLSMDPIDITPRVLDQAKWHHQDRAAALDLLDRARRLRDLPRIAVPSFDERLRPESHFERRDRVAREKREREEENLRRYNETSGSNITREEISRPPSEPYSAQNVHASYHNDEEEKL